MVSSRKRGWQEMDAPQSPQAPQESSILDRLRNMWEFANLAQWIFIFGKAVKLDESIDIEELESDCLKPQSTLLPAIGLSILKFVSSHRGLTPELFDEYTRRQYLAKSPALNPFGTDEIAAKFTEFDVCTKIRVLQQMTQWTLRNPDRMRERMDEQKEIDQTYWRIEPFGWDADDRTYFVLDDNRLYRRTDPPPPPPPAPKAKKNKKKFRSGTRSSKRRRTLTIVESDSDELEEDPIEPKEEEPEGENTLGGMKWECLAISFQELVDFLKGIEKSRDPNEKVLRKRLTDDLLPILEKQEESRKRKEVQKQRELLNLQKMAHAKRSSRIAGRQEQQRQEEEIRESERKKQADLVLAKKEQERWMKLEKERESRIQTREKRVKEREARRLLHEQELAELSENSKKLEEGESRISERALKQQMERKKQELEQLDEEDGDWIFDCICGAYGQIDDGSHSIACEKCNIWQHSKCVKIKVSDAEREDFHFICSTCKKRVEEAEKAKSLPQIKIKLNTPGSSSSTTTPSKTAVEQSGTPAKTTNGHSVSHTTPSKPKTTPSEARPNGSSPVKRSPASVQPQSTPMSAPLSSARLSSDDTRPHMTPAQNRSQVPGSIVNANGSFSSHNAFSPPAAYSPISLPPPTQPRTYATFSVNQTQHPTPGMANSSPNRPDSAQRDNASMFNQAPSILSVTNGSPAQTLNPPERSQQTTASSAQQSPVRPSSGPIDQRSGVPISPVMKETGFPSSVPQQQYSIDQHGQLRDADPGHASALPPSFTGVSPVKHSPPRPSTANQGISSSATPSVLPPVASLPPSSPLQNLTPPVKTSEPAVPKENGQLDSIRD